MENILDVAKHSNEFLIILQLQKRNRNNETNCR